MLSLNYYAHFSFYFPLNVYVLSCIFDRICMEKACCNFLFIIVILCYSQRPLCEHPFVVKFLSQVIFVFLCGAGGGA